MANVVGGAAATALTEEVEPEREEGHNVTPGYLLKGSGTAEVRT